MSRKKKRIHLSLPGPIFDALEALAELEGRAVSDIVDELTRTHLRGRGVLPEPTTEEIVKAISKRKRS